MSNKYISLVITIVVLIVSLQCSQRESIGRPGFFAHYTEYGEDDAITGPFPDVVVNIDDKKQIVFCRETSYRPFLLTGGYEFLFDEIIPRTGDGTSRRPDKNNIYSYIRIIDQSSEKILVHWRYMPDIKNVVFEGVVHEYFTIYPDGKVHREIRQGEANLVDFRDPQNKTIQDLQLIDSGINVLSTVMPALSKSDIPALTGNPMFEKLSFPSPSLYWPFDEGRKNRKYEEKDFVFDVMNMIPCKILGNIALWKNGVSGTALAFDGYQSKVRMAKGILTQSLKNWSMEAWVALGVYPWQWGSLVDISERGEGLTIGITDLGEFGLKYVRGDTIIKVLTDEQIPLSEWTHVGISFDQINKIITLFLNGKPVHQEELTIGQLKLPNTELSIGLNKIPLRTTQHVSRDYPPEVRTPKGNQPMIYGIEGLIDEVRLYLKTLTNDQILESFNYLKPSDEIKKNPDLEKRILPGMVDGRAAEKFSAVYTNLKYHDLWDNLWRSSDYPDVVVRFDELPTSVVYWRGSNYGPGWVTENNIWMSDQSCEIYHEYGCAEHMADKQNRHSHVRIIENHDARVLIHWRYASVDILYEFENERIWADEYHYIYPDGTAIRYVTYHDEPTGWQDVQFFAPAGSPPEDQIDLQALTVANLKGEIYKMDWSDGIPENELEDALISIVNFKSEYKVLVIYPDEVEGIGAWGEQERATPETHFAGPWNHWPVSQMPNDGRYAMRTDRVTHSALGGAGPSEYAIYGFTNKEISELVPLTRFWNRAPEINVRNGAATTEFKMSEKAYHVDVTGAKVDLEIKASSDSPLYNPVFVLKNWNGTQASITIDGKKIETGPNCRIGSRYTSNGINLIVWIRMNRENTVNTLFEK
jgi:hypothetical protein